MDCFIDQLCWRRDAVVSIYEQLFCQVKELKNEIEKIDDLLENMEKQEEE